MLLSRPIFGALRLSLPVVCRCRPCKEGRTEVGIDLGCGKHKRREAFGFDCRKEPGVNALCDIEWSLPLESNCADAVHLRHVKEHVRDSVPFMEEVYRICKPGAEVQVTVPCYTSRRADRFRIEAISYDTRRPFRYWPEYFRTRCRRHLWNVVENMPVTLRVVKP